MISTYDAGVLVCDTEGRILMHDEEVVRLLRAVHALHPQPDGGGIGRARERATQTLLLGTSVDEYLDARLMRTAMQECRTASGQQPPARRHTSVLATARGRYLVEVEVRAVPGASMGDGGGQAAFIILIRQKAAWREGEAKSHQLLRELTESMRGPLASVRAAIETMQQYPSMDAETADHFKRIIGEQAVVLSEQLEATVVAYARLYRSTWPLDTMATDDFLLFVEAQVRGAVDVPVHVDPPDAPPDDDVLRLAVDTLSFARLIEFLAQRIVHAVRCSDLTLRFQPVRHSVALDMAWTGDTVTTTRLHKWLAESLFLGDSMVQMTLGEIINYHEGQIWAQAENDESRIRILLPVL